MDEGERVVGDEEISIENQKKRVVLKYIKVKEVYNHPVIYFISKFRQMLPLNK